MWSKELQELSEEYLEYDGVNVKSKNGQFGIINIDYENKVYEIILLNSIENQILTFYSVDEIIKAGWVVD
jgi:hypothetical protein